MFVNLHDHTMYSLLDSVSKPEQIIEKLKSINQTAFAITDHGHCYNAPEIYKLFKENNIKFLYGCELYICEDATIKDKNNKYYHLVAIAYSEQGRINLNELVSFGNLEGMYYKPRVDYKELLKYKDGLIIMSACMAGEIQRVLRDGNKELAKEVALRYKKDFGGNYYLEFQNHQEPTQIELNKQVISLAEELGIKYVVTADSHYINKEDQEFHSIFVQIGQSREVGETYTDCYIQSEEEIRNGLCYLTEEQINNAINNTVIIANKCNVEIPLSAPIIPHVDIPKGFKSELQYVKHLCNIGWKTREIDKLPKEKIKEYKDRLYYEMNAVQKMGFEGYYLLVYSYCNSVKRRGVARGSGGGSLIAYLLNIIDIDPIEYGLYFERFIDVSAIELIEQGNFKPEDIKIPDVDSDFGGKDREKVLKFITDTYGFKRVVSIGTFHYLRARSTIKDVGRVLNIPYQITDEMTKNMDDEETLQDAIDGGSLSSYVEQYPKLFEYVLKLANLPKSFSVHASGKIVALEDITHYHPVTSSSGVTALECDMGSSDLLGLVKVDLLGLTTIDVIYDTLEMIGKDYSYINPKYLDFKDEKILENFRQGNTVGIFQFESKGMQETLKSINITELYDLISANALYRPGSKKYIPNYAARKNGLEKFEYLHPDLEPILKNTYGIIVFQEQLIEIGRLAGMKNPDLIRKATAKKKPELMAIVEPELKNGLMKRGWTQEQVDQLWEDILLFSRYSFNKSHSAGYGIIAFITMKLKTYHPIEFMCALLNNTDDKDKKPILLQELRRLSIKIEKPNWKKSTGRCKVIDSKFYLGSEFIKDCNEENGIELQQLSNNNYESFYELLFDIKSKTKINSTQLNVFAKLGYFFEFANNKKILDFISLYDMIGEAKQMKKDKAELLGLTKVFEQHSAKITEKMYKDFDINTILKKQWNEISNNRLGVVDQLITESEYTYYPQTTYKCPDYYIVLSIDTKYTPVAKCYNLATGNEVKYKIYKNVLFSKPSHENPNSIQLLQQYDIISIGKTQEKDKVRKGENEGEWIPTGEKELILFSWTIVKKYQPKS